ncbi:MAG: rhomboid family intrarane serine protease [Mucilaginibacter sp.]|jgi:membrane associated rhomboid family serine protease|nr:rhomboid family intrarane serine protease [Mucilaginibacter sp.]
MSTLWKDIQYKMLRSGSKLNLLIGINIIVFLVINVTGTLEQFIFRSNFIDNYSADYLALTAYLPKLEIRFWTPFTYMFMHAGVFHILFNMLWLYWMGQIFEEYLGKKRTLGLYIMGGLAGALLYIISFNVFPFFTESHASFNSTMVGASAGVMAIIVATATLLPDYTLSLILIGPVKLKWLVLFFVIIDFLGIVGPNAGGEIAHLGGAWMGFVYIKQVQRGNDWIGAITNLFRSKSKLKVVSKNPLKNSSGIPRQEEIDFILDKISKSGYDSLSKQEKEILFRASNNNEG